MRKVLWVIFGIKSLLASAFTNIPPKIFSLLAHRPFVESNSSVLAIAA